MKKYILFLIISIASHFLIAQTASIYIVNSDATSVNAYVAIPAKSFVFNSVTNQLYFINTKQAAGRTLAQAIADGQAIGNDAKIIYSSQAGTPTAINSLITATGIKTVVIDSPITSSWTIPAGVTLKRVGLGLFSGSITITGNYTIIENGPTRLFSDATTVSGTWKAENDIYPIEWFGAIQDTLTDCSPAFRKTLKAFGNAYLSGKYGITDSISIYRWYKVTMTAQTYIYWNSAGKNLFQIHEQPFEINGNGAIIRVPSTGNNGTAFKMDFGTSGMQRLGTYTQIGRYGFVIKNISLYGYNWLPFTTAGVGKAPNGIMAKTNKNGYVYFGYIENVRFHKCDTMVSIQNNGTEAYNGWKFTNIVFDTPLNRAIVIGNSINSSRSTSHEFNNITLQDTRAGAICVDIYSSRNQLNGVYFDDSSDSAILLRPSARDNKLNFTWSGQATASGVYSITDHGQGNIIDRSIVNQYISFTYPSTGTNAGRQTLAGKIGWYSNTYTISWEGSYLAFRAGTASTYRMASTYFRSNGNLAISLGQAAYRWKDFYSAKITDNGSFVGINTATPLYDLDVTGTANFRNTIITASLEVNTSATFTDVFKITPQGSPPASPVKGQIYINVTDNHAYFYNGTTWKQLDN